jgi:YbbR domain-containing protein
VDPPFAVVTGTIEALQSLTLVATDEVDIGGATSNVARAAKLRLPSDLTVVGSDTVTVEISISPARGEITVGVTPAVQGLEAGLKASLGTNLVEVRVAGGIPDLRALSPAGVTAVIDAAGLQEGVHSLPVQVTLPPGLQVVSVEPATVVVTIETA